MILNFEIVNNNILEDETSKNTPYCSITKGRKICIIDFKHDADLDDCIFQFDFETINFLNSSSYYEPSEVEIKTAGDFLKEYLLKYFDIEELGTSKNYMIKGLKENFPCNVYNSFNYERIATLKNYKEAFSYLSKLIESKRPEEDLNSIYVEDEDGVKLLEIDNNEILELEL